MKYNFIKLLELGYLITSRKKTDGSDGGPEPEPMPLNSELWCFFLFPFILLCHSI